MPIQICRLLAFDGPNIAAPQPGVLLHALGPADASAALRAALKEAAQRAGVVIGALDTSAARRGGSFLLSASFTTPTPELGAAVARLAVDWLNADEAGEEADAYEEALWELQRRRRASALPLAALQLTARAQSLNLPAFVRDDGALQIGSGVRSWSIELDRLRARPHTEPIALAVPEVPWERIGAVPLVAVTGGRARDAVVEEVAAALRRAGAAVSAATQAPFDAVGRLLADPSAEVIIVGLEAEDLLRRGLPFTGCVCSAVLGLPEPPAVWHEPEELARAVCLPALVTAADGIALLDAGAPEIVELAEYAAAPTVLLGPEPDPRRLAALAAREILARLEGLLA